VICPAEKCCEILDEGKCRTRLDGDDCLPFGDGYPVRGDVHCKFKEMGAQGGLKRKDGGSWMKENPDVCYNNPLCGAGQYPEKNEYSYPESMGPTLPTQVMEAWWWIFVVAFFIILPVGSCGILFYRNRRTWRGHLHAVAPPACLCMPFFVLMWFVFVCICLSQEALTV
jgi:hypothetical protein